VLLGSKQLDWVYFLESKVLLGKARKNLSPEMKAYPYVGSSDLLPISDDAPQRCKILCEQDILDWIDTTHQTVDSERSIVATFVIDKDGRLWIADRHSEHVQCARGREVLSAGEMTFTITSIHVEVSAITNQSTGYCPEPESWSVVRAALDLAMLKHPPHFTSAFTFRRCTHCRTTNIVKENWFICGVCMCELPDKWNYA
jgi:hypothetical protein